MFAISLKKMCWCLAFVIPVVNAQTDSATRATLRKFADGVELKNTSDDHLPQRNNCLMPGTTPPPDGCKRDLTAAERTLLKEKIASYEAKAAAISWPSNRRLADNLGANNLVVGRCIERISTALRDKVLCGASAIDPRNKKQAWSATVVCPIRGGTGRLDHCTDVEAFNAAQYEWDVGSYYAFPDKYP
jgi:hypothetical protein